MAKDLLRGHTEATYQLREAAYAFQALSHLFARDDATAQEAYDELCRLHVHTTRLGRELAALVATKEQP